MTPELASWASQIPWVPLGVAAVAVGLWFVASTQGKKKKAALVAKLESGAHVIDVRSKGEFSSGHHPGAVNIPLDSLAGQMKKLGASDRPLVVYCASGGRSAQAAAQLRAAGFTDVTDAGGLANMPR